ncbi:MAG: hypothetical protein ACP5E4_02900, partial [Candidatus Aenigmatarchaeota archaeon]
MKHTSTLLFSCALFWVLTSISFALGQGIYFSGLSTDAEEYAAGETLKYETQARNGEGFFYPGLTLESKLYRKADGALVARETKPIDLGAMEAKYLSGALVVPKNALSGEYSLVLEILNPTGAPVSSIVRDVCVRSTLGGGVLFGDGGVYLRVPVTTDMGGGVIRTVTKSYYGTVGDTIPLESMVSVGFSLKNAGAIPKVPECRVMAIPTYSPDSVPEVKTEKLGLLLPGEKKGYFVDIFLDEPGTYRV